MPSDVRMALREAFNAGLATPPAATKVPQCATCNDNGMIGGPSYYEPGEGGEPCPDCSPAAHGATTRETAWQPIETAPKHTEVIVWREDSGPFIAKLTTPDAVITPEEMEREGLEFPEDFEEWYSDAYGWQEGDEKPTHWMHLPEAPVAARKVTPPSAQQEGAV